MDKQKIERAADLAKMVALQSASKHRAASECEVSKLMLDTANDREGLERHIREDLAYKFGEVINNSEKFKVQSEEFSPSHSLYLVMRNRMEAYIFTKEELTQVFDDLIHAITQELIKEGDHGQEQSSLPAE
ncbi:hypothetical protein [Paenibacillus sp. DMB20]|uniref:hypothetical protein n=1 Tax=Paenibacillus sp. DMB20 TaxID=1642570 RepID=UPI000627DC26|nr:hypothetical protein [Paenibacillus sp. DMB20]KKO51137.1 hypothetical protein XI25_29565 [Paenibacillus sp. DMB20]